MEKEVLVVEDSPDSQDLVTELLRGSCRLTLAPSMKKALRLVQEKSFDLILMDVMLEDGDGFSLTTKIRSLPGYHDLPIIFMTSKGDIQDKATGFELGAEDYIVKPFDPLEFKLRVQSRLKKIQAHVKSQILSRGNLRLEASLQKAFLIQEGIQLDLTPLQFKILFTLVNHEPEVLTRERLTTLIWGEGVQVGRSLDTHITALRKKLGAYGEHIQGVYGLGYRFSSLL